MKTPIENAKYNDLMKLAKLHQLETPRGTTEAQLRVLIRTALPDLTEIEVEGEAPAHVEVRNFETGQLSAHYKDDPKVTIIIAPDELSKNHSQAPIPICVGSDHITVRRGEKVTIPYRFFLVLKNAIEDDRRMGDLDHAAMRYNVVETERQAINFSTLDMPSQAEIAAFHERTKDLGRGDDAIIEHRKISRLGHLLTEAA